MDYIRPETCRLLQRAQLFLVEMKEDFYVEALQAEGRKNPPAADFITVPAVADANQPVLFSLRFAREDLNGVAACRE
jgi:hypothetical protein